MSKSNPQRLLITEGEYKGQYGYMYFEQECNALVKLESTGEIVGVEYPFLEVVPAEKGAGN